MAAEPKEIAQQSPTAIDQRVYDLYDEYCHGRIDRREFLARASALVVGGVSALAMAQALFPRYVEAQTISFTDTRIKAKYVEYASPGGNSGEMRGYLVQPAGNGPFPAVPPFDWFDGCYVSGSSWHGSHVAGTIGAVPNNGIGIAVIN